MKLRNGQMPAEALRLAMLCTLIIGPMLLNGCGGNGAPQSQHGQPDSTGQKTERKVLYWRAPMDPTYTSDRPGKSPMGMDLIPVYEGEVATADTAAASPGGGDGGNKGKKILYWRAPMDPTYISKEPGKSPMGMDLIPVYEGEDQSGGPTVVIDPVTIQNMGVQTAPVRKMNLHRVIRTVGYLNYDERALRRVNIKFPGWVEKLYVDQTGQRIRKGQPMFSIYSPDLVVTQKEYLLAYRNAKNLAKSPFGDVSGGGESLLESARRRLLYWDISEDQVRDLEATGEVSKTITLRAPADGVVIAKMVEEGMRVTPGMDLYQMADLRTLWVYGQIYQSDVPFVRVGQPVTVHVSYMPGRTYSGKVDFVYPFLENKTRDVNVRIVVPNPTGELKPEMYATVQFESSIGAGVTAIPSDAVIRTGSRDVVFVARGGGKFEPRNCVLGPEGQNGFVQVLSGVVPGEHVVTSGQFMIDSESRLKDAIQKMLEAKRGGEMSPSTDNPEPMPAQAPVDVGTSNTQHVEVDRGHHPMESTDSQAKDDALREGGKPGEPDAMPGMQMDKKKEAVDPVCGMKIAPEENLSWVYRGTRYYFCSEEDMVKFKQDPGRYASSPKH